MCFRNLPIELDSAGKATLKEGLDDPWGVRHAADRRRRELDFPAVPREAERTVVRAAGPHAFGLIINHRRGAR